MRTRVGNLILASLALLVCLKGELGSCRRAFCAPSAMTLHLIRIFQSQRRDVQVVLEEAFLSGYGLREKGMLYE
jgi:hypothetical protein